MSDSPTMVWCYKVLSSFTGIFPHTRPTFHYSQSPLNPGFARTHSGQPRSHSDSRSRMNPLRPPWSHSHTRSRMDPLGPKALFFLDPFRPPWSPYYEPIQTTMVPKLSSFSIQTDLSTWYESFTEHACPLHMPLPREVLDINWV